MGDRARQGGTNPLYDQNHVIYYQYWTRSFNATGEMTVFQSFADGDEVGNCGDFLVGFDYNSNTKDIENFPNLQLERRSARCQLRRVPARGALPILQ